MLLRPWISCCQPQPRSILLSRHSIPPTLVYLATRTYTTPRPYRSISRVATVAFHCPPPEALALNPPSTTRPPPLNLPEKLPGLPKYKYYFRIGQAYRLFYQSGLRAIFTNFQVARALPKQTFFSDWVKIHQAVRDGRLSRADFQLIRRTRRDIGKMPRFALIWAICGSFTPLVVLLFTGVVPRTLWIPKQVQKARQEAENRRAKSREESVEVFAGPSWLFKIESMPEATQHNVLKFYAQSLGLYPVWWDRWIPTVIPTSLVRRRVYTRLAELEVDDFAIERDGGVGKMDIGEVQMACEERGIDILGKEEGNLRRDLEQWMKRRNMLLPEAKDANADVKIKDSIGIGK